MKKDQKSLLPTNEGSRSLNYFRPTSERKWELAYGKDKFYLTDKEKESFLKGVAMGAKYIVVGNLVLSPNFSYLAPAKERRPKWETL